MATPAFVKVQQEGVERTSDGVFKAWRGLRDGSGIVVPWMVALQLEGRVFSDHAGTVTTGIAGHAGVDADQPEMAWRVPDGTVAIPLHLRANLESGETTLGVHGLMFAISNIDVGNGTSVAGTPINLRLDAPIAIASTVRNTYSANGTDPLTASNYTELGRIGGTIDSNVADSGLTMMVPLDLNAGEHVLGAVLDTGSILGYGEGGTSAVFFFQMKVAELPESAVN